MSRHVFINKINETWLSDWYKHCFHDVNCIINATVLFSRWRQVKQGVTWLLVMWCCWQHCQSHITLIALPMAPFCLLAWDNWDGVQHDFFGYGMPVLASQDTNGIINSTMVFVRSKWLKWHARWLFQFFDIVGSSISITWFHWHCQ